MKHKLIAILVAIAAVAVMVITGVMHTGCTTKDGHSDTVTMTTDTLSLTSAFTKSNGEVCRQQVTLKVAYPKHYKDDKTTDHLQSLYAQVVLDAPDSVGVKEAITLYGRSIILGDTPEVAMTAPADSTLFDDDELADVDSISTTVNVTTQYNSHGILTLCREEIMTKNGRETSRIHRYFNLDLEAMALVEVNRMFKDVHIDDITALLTSQLMAQNEATSEDQLNDMGYFNLPIVDVSNNFFFTQDGITWCYEPNTLAVATIGEPKIHLTFEQLKYYDLENRVLNRF
ncbi:MAG: DUF3298 domain-containing protein [Muribaculaceae bacterium]|nr:DUF3298 domain-containing protein [Muribaculaceae bacterium]